MKRYYFDYAAATPMDPEVEKAMKPYWSAIAGNPGSLHWFGQEASAAVFSARDTIAKSLGCHYSEIIFTGSATEANNLALRGVIKGLGFRVKGLEKNNQNNLTPIPHTLAPKIIVSAIEHDSILDTCKDLEKEGVEVVYLPVSKKGIVDLIQLKDSLDDRTVLVSIMYANNEIGVIQPISEIAKIISDFRNERLASSVQRLGESKQNFKTLNPNRSTLYPIFHTDAVQAFNYLTCNVDALGVDMLTLSAQKIYGPKGVGLLYKRLASSVQRLGGSKQNFKTLNPNRSTLAPIITGGGQEHGFRSGTENVPGIVGFAKAIMIADALREKEVKRLKVLQSYLLKKLQTLAPMSELNGDREKRIPNNINIYLPPKKNDKGTAQNMVISLDLAGFAVSPGSACSARTCSPSHVLKALGHSDIRATSGLRITLGRQTNKQAIDALVSALRKSK